MTLEQIHHKDFYLCIDSTTGLKKLLWLSFQRKGHISLGFFDKNFTVPAISDGTESILDLVTKLGLSNVRNPHFTLHFSECPSHFHLKSETGTVLCEALVWARPSPGEEVAPWLRFVSNPISELEIYQGPPHGRKADIIRLASPNEDCSVAIHVDFAEPPVNPSNSAEAGYFSWRDVPLRVIAFCIPAQAATLGYEINV